MAETARINPELLRKLASGDQNLDEFGYDLKNLTSVLANLQLFRQKDAKSTKKPEKERKSKSVTLSEPRIIGKASTATPQEGSAASSETESDKMSRSTRSSKRGSRGQRRSRKKRTSKRLEARIAEDLLSRVSSVSARTRQTVLSNDASTIASSTEKALPPPNEFFKYPQILPQRDHLKDPVTGEKRPVWSITIPLVCHKSNTPFYAQCSTSKQGYCTRCGVLRKGHQRTGSICTEQGCGERLTAKYHRWYPGLVRLEPFAKERNKEDYQKNKELFEKFGICWNSADELSFVVENYILMKVFLVSPDFDIAPLHLERSYMIGVFAGRAFHTGALARKYLRDGLKLMSFRADFPEAMKYMANYRANVVEELNQIFFQGRFRCYFHAHQSNIEGWYDPTQVDPNTIRAYFKEICNRHLTMRKEGSDSSSRMNTRISSRPPRVNRTSRVAHPVKPGRFDFARRHLEQRVTASSTSSKGEANTELCNDTSDDEQPEPLMPQPQISYVPMYFSAPPMQGHPMQAHPMQGHPMQGHPMQTHPMQAHPMQAHPMQAHPMQTHPMQAHPNAQPMPYMAAPSMHNDQRIQYAPVAYMPQMATQMAHQPYGYAMPAYGQPSEISNESQSRVMKPVYPTHFVPVHTSQN